MLRTAILEASKEKREYIAAALEASENDIKVVEFSDKYDFYESLNEDASSYDIVILNTTIQKEGDGIEIARILRNKNFKIMILFVTDSKRYYPEAFNVFATGYLLYPLDVKDLYNCINFYYQKASHEPRASWMFKEKAGNYRRIFCRYITHIESNNRELIVHLEDGSKVTTYGKLSQAEAELPEKGFVRCHQSYIVNLYFVDEIQKSQFVISGADIPISRKYQNMVREVYYDYMFNKM